MTVARSAVPRSGRMSGGRPGRRSRPGRRDERVAGGREDRSGSSPAGATSSPAAAEGSPSGTATTATSTDPVRASAATSAPSRGAARAGCRGARRGRRPARRAARARRPPWRRRARGRARRPRARPSPPRAAATWARIASARSSRSAPAGVSSTPCGVRVSRRTPSSCSRRRTCCETAGCVRCRASAARVTCPCRATAAKVSSWRRSTGARRLPARDYPPAPVNFAREIVEAAVPGRLALVELARDGARRECTFGEVAADAGTARGRLHETGRAPRRRRADAHRQPSGVGRRDGGVLPAGHVVLPLHGAAPRRRTCGCAWRSPPRARRLRRAQRGRPARGGLGRADGVGALGRLASRRRRPAAGRARPRGPVPGDVHERHRGRAEGRRSTPSATSPASACRASTGSTPARATSSGARRPAAGASRRATPSSRPGCAAPPPCCTTRASTPTSGWTILERERPAILCMAPTEYRVLCKRARAAAGRRPARRRRRRRGAEPRGAARLARGDGALDPRRLRADGDRPAHGHAARRRRPARIHGPPAARACGSGSTTGSCAPTR